jgi:hypothetical protein
MYFGAASRRLIPQTQQKRKVKSEHKTHPCRPSIRPASQVSLERIANRKEEDKKRETK